MLDYGIIGNCNTCALVKKNASIDWFCYPEFASSSVFAKILDEKQGGSFEILAKGYTITQNYIKNTAILETHFKSKNDEFVVIDFFPRYAKLLPSKRKRIFQQNKIIRIIKPIKGKPKIKVKFNPQLNYAKGITKLSIIKNNLVAKNKTSNISLISNVDLNIIQNEDEFELNHTKYFIIGSRSDASKYSVTSCNKFLSATKRYWLRWVNTLNLPDKRKDLIIRSALTLKLLTYSKTGAIIAAATTSIPEEVGSERNWDYRFCWIRDASFTADALKKIGRKYEARELINFIFRNTLEKRKNLQIMYGIDGRTKLTEKKLLHLNGFKGSTPVRIGNAAYSQKQHDIYGSILDVLYLYFVFYKYEKKLSKKYWNFVKYLVNEIKKCWKQPDSGIWEFRGKKQHHTYSKMMCYVGIDRAVKIAQHFEKNDLAEKWVVLRDEIGEDFLKKSWNEKKHAFTMYYGSSHLDAAVLQMTYHEILDRNDPRIVSTVKQINNELRKGFLTQRYQMQDDFGVSTSAFNICSFWLVDSLYEIGEKEDAEKLFDKLVSYSNHLGLFAEDTDIKTKKVIGNFPQAYTHLAIINSAILLSEWSSKRRYLGHYDLRNLNYK